MYEEAVHAFDQAVRLDPGLAEAYYRRAGVREALGRMEEAIADYGRVSGFSDRYLLACCGRGLARRKFGRARDADWFGENDLGHLSRVSEDSAVTLVCIAPLTDSDVISILRGRFTDAQARRFIASAGERGIDALLGNPQGLNLLAAVVAEEGVWPGSRFETFDKDCSQSSYGLLPPGIQAGIRCLPVARR